MDENSTSPFKNVSLYVGVVVVAIIVAAALGSYSIWKKRTAVPGTSQTPTPPPQSFGSMTSPTPSPVLGASTPNSQPATGPALSYYAVLLGAISSGLYLARYKKRL